MKKKILLSILLISFLSVLIVGFFSLFQVVRVKEEIKGIQQREIGQLYKTNSQIIKNSTKSSIKMLAEEEANNINDNFERVGSNINMLKNVLTQLYESGNNVHSQFNDQDYIYYFEDTNYEAIKNEFNRIKSIRDTISSMVNEYTDTHIYYVSESGFVLNLLDLEENIYEGQDLKSQNWYKGAIEKNGMYWTEVYKDLLTDNLVITCSMPIYDPHGNLKGVIAEDFVLDFVCREVLKPSIAIINYAFLSASNSEFIIGSDEFLTDMDFLGDLKESYFEYVKNNIDEGVYIGSNIIIGYSKVTTSDWIVSLVFDYNQVVSPIEEIGTSINETHQHIINALEVTIIITLIIYIIFLISLIIVVLFSSSKLSKSITEPLDVLSQGAKMIGNGDLSHKIIVDSNDEIGELADTFNVMTDELQGYIENIKVITSQKERIEVELKIANTIQLSMMPSDFPDKEKFEIYANVKPAKSVGGDFYDFFYIDENHIAIVMADVSSKGIPAALFMVEAKNTIKEEAQRGNSPKIILENTNNKLCENNKANMFVTAFIGILDIRNGNFIYANAGHNPPLLRRNQKTFEYMKLKKNFILAGIDNIKYSEDVINLKSGDILYLYTDGVTEALNIQQELFSEVRLANCLNKIDPRIHLKDILNAVSAEINKFSNGAEQADDITMLILRIK